MGRGKAYIINLNLQMSWSIKTNIIQHGGGTPLKRFHSHGQEACALFKCQKINSWQMTRRTIPPSLSLSLAVNSCAVLQVFWKFHFILFRLGSQGGGVPLAMRRHYDGLVLEMLGVFLLSCAHFDHNRSISHLCIPNWAVNLFLPPIWERSKCNWQHNWNGQCDRVRAGIDQCQKKT